jgi:opacity protein-like surface antigen
MKKILLSAVAIMALGTAAQAQDMSFGVKAGLNIANVGGDAETAGSRMGLHIGGLAEFKLSETFAIQPELLYSMQGAKMEFVDFNEETFAFTTEEEDLKLDYLIIPIMGKYYVTESLSIEAGPQIGFLMSAKAGDTDVKDGYEGVDFGINGGLGYALEGGLFFQARYYLGLTSIVKEVEVPEFEGFDIEVPEVKAQNNVLSVSVGYKF